MCFHERGLSSWKKTRVWIALHPGVVNKPRLRLNRDQRGKALMSQARNSTTLRTRRKLLLQLKTQTHNFPLHLWTWRPPRVSAAYLSQVLFSRTPGPCLGLSLPRDAPARSPRCRTRVCLENDPVCKGHRRLFGELTQPDPWPDCTAQDGRPLLSLENSIRDANKIS